MRSILKLLILLLVASCANRVNPTGGQKDTSAPELVEAIPSQRTTEMKDKEIRLRFDEYIQLNDFQGQFIISPLTSKLPEVKVGKKELVITLPDSLLPNTTYTLSFGKSIVDVHEANPLVDFQYVFSTGSYIDSLEMNGEVYDASTLALLKNITVLVYRKTGSIEDDSLPFLRKPDYFARTNDKGVFSIRNMAAGNYLVFGLDDKNNNYKCDNPQEEAFAFLDFPVTVPSTTVLKLMLSVQEAAQTRIARVSRIDRQSLAIGFNRGSDSISFSGWNGEAWNGQLFFWSEQHDTLKLFQQPEADSIKLLVADQGVVFDTVRVMMAPAKGVKEPAMKVRILLRSSPATAGPAADAVFGTLHPITDGLDSVEVVEDSAKAVTMKLEPENGVQGRFKLRFPWKEGARYRLKFYPGAVTDIFNVTNDTTTFEFTVPDEKSSAMLSIKTEGLTSGKQYLLQLTNEKFELIRQFKLSGDSSISLSHLPAATMRLRVITDVDRNNRFTLSHYGRRRQPEPVYIYPETLTLRANWEQEVILKWQE